MKPPQVKSTIRHASPDDLSKIKEVLEQNGQKSNVAVSSQCIFLISDDPESGETMGVAGAELNGHAALIRSVAVLSGYRKKGIAHELVNALINHLSQRSISHAYLFSKNTGEFWKKFGFHECPVQEVADQLPNAAQVQAYLKDGSLWSDVAWHRLV